MATYFITGVWFDDDRYISHVMLHLSDNSTSWKKGKKTPVADVIKLIEEYNTVETKRWNYHVGDWVQGARVVIVLVDNIRTIDTVLNAGIPNRLEHMMRMKTIV